MAHLFSQRNYIRNSTIMNAHLHMAENLILTIKNSPLYWRTEKNNIKIGEIIK